MYEVKPLKNDEKILGREEHWRVRLLKESAPMLVFEDLLRMTSTEINTIWWPLMNKI